MEPPVLEPVAPPTSLSEYKERKAERAAGSAAPPAGEKAHAVPQGETAGSSASPPQETQEKTPKPPRAKNAEERAAELRAAGRHKEADKILSDDAEQKEFATWKASKADRDREAEELRTLRARPAAPVASAPPAPPPAAPSAAAEKPKLTDFLAKPENSAKTHDDVVEEWEEAVHEWRSSKRKVETEAEKLQGAFVERQSAVKSAHPDYDAVTSGENFQRTLLNLAPQAVAVAAHELPQGVEVLYRLAKDADECRRIAGLSPTSQIIELGVMSRAIAAETSGTVKHPEKTPAPPPVSRTPPPPRSLGGIAPGELTESKNPPTSLAEHKQRKAARAS